MLLLERDGCSLPFLKRCSYLSPLERKFVMRNMKKVAIQLNGEDFKIDDGSTISDLLKLLDIHPMGVAVEHNRHIVKKRDYDKAILREGDQLEVIHFVGGG